MKRLLLLALLVNPYSLNAMSINHSLNYIEELITKYTGKNPVAKAQIAGFMTAVQKNPILTQDQKKRLQALQDRLTEKDKVAAPAIPKPQPTPMPAPKVTPAPQQTPPVNNQDLLKLLTALNSKNTEDAIKKITQFATLEKQVVELKNQITTLQQDPLVAQLLTKLGSKNIQDAIKNLDTFLNGIQAKTILDAVKNVEAIKNVITAPAKDKDAVVADEKLVNILEQYNPATLSEDKKDELINKLKSAVSDQRDKAKQSRATK